MVGYTVAGVAQRVEWPVNHTVTGSIHRAHAWVAGQAPVGGVQEATTH